MARRATSSSLLTHTLPDPRFERDGADLCCLQDLRLTDAVLGAELRVATFDGWSTVKVRPGMQPDTVLRLRGLGLPHFGGGEATRRRARSLIWRVARPV